ncbi:type II secretion system protein [bacterium]|nr:type II secretion system protein [bacterium]
MNILELISRVDFSLPLITGLSRSIRSLVMTKKKTPLLTCLTPHPTLSHKGRGYEKVAFTLAEVLITLGIIGVVAAMTLPAVIQHHKEKAIITKLKKNYSTIQQAYLMALNEKGPIDTWGITTAHSETSNILYHLKDYLKISKYCGLGSGCWYSTPMYALNGRIFNSEPDDRGYYSKAILADGSMIMMYTSNEKSGFYRVDVNGKKPPNAIGKDIFTFEIKENKVEPWGLEMYPFDDFCNPADAGSAEQGRGCTAWLIVHENMDYLHCIGLSWNGKHSCKQK